MKLLALVVLGMTFGAHASDAQPKQPSPKGPKSPKPKPEEPPPPPEPEKSPEKIRADKLFEDGRRYLAAGEFKLACTAFEQSQAAEPAIGTQLNIALCYEAWGKIASAQKAYAKAEQLAKLAPTPDEREAGARKKIEELAPKVPYLTVDIPANADAAIAFFLDGVEQPRETFAAAIAVDPGQHTIEARMAGRAPTKTVVELTIGERKRIAIEVPQREMVTVMVQGPRNMPRLYAGIGLVGGGTIAVGVATVVSLLARGDYAAAVANCPARMCESRADYDATQSARRRATYMTFVGIGGLGLAGAGAYLIASSRGKPIAERRAVTLMPIVEPGAVGVAIGGSL